MPPTRCAGRSARHSEVVSRNAVWTQYSGLFVQAIRQRDGYCPYLVLIPYYLCRTLTDDHTGSHGIAGCHAWHDRSIRNAKVLDAVNLEITIHHRHLVTPHFGGGCLMQKAKRCVADVVF